MFAQMVIDRITETENLTDNLDDDTASWLINWGIQAAKQLVSVVSSSDAASDQINQIMAVMRLVNQLLSLPQSDQMTFASDLTELTTSYQAAFGTVAAWSTESVSALFLSLAEKTPLEQVQSLLAALGAQLRK